MHLRFVSAALTALALVTISCSENSITGHDSSKGSVAPPAGAPRFVVVSPTVPSIRISEFHYDNVSTDAGEQVEISGPAGTDLTNWKIVLYNGNGGAVYGTKILSGTIPATCTPRGVVATATVGIQNGDPDGIALVDGSGSVIELISYGGSFTAVGGPAGGMVTRNIGVKESSTTAIGNSLSRDQAGTWFGPATNTFGACNDNTDPPTAAVVASVGLLPATSTLVPGAKQQFAATAKNSSNVALPGAMIGWTSTDPTVASVDVNGAVTAVQVGTTQIIATATNGLADTSSVQVNAAPPPSGLSNVRLTEIHYDNDATDINEKIEIEGPAGGDLSGWKIVLYNQTGGAVYDTQVLNMTIPATCDTRGVVTVSYPSNGIQNGPADGFALVSSDGQVVEFLSYEGTLTATNGPAMGLLSTDIGISESGSGSSSRSLQRDATGAWYGPALNSFDQCNPAAPPPPAIFFSGRTPGDPALPVGFQDQLFAALEDASGNAITTTFTWTTETPSVASIDQDGVITALSAGTAILRATAATGATGTWTLPTRVAVASATAMYAGNAEFGVLSDADATDDFIVTHPEYTLSFNRNRGTPNWVSYDLDATHFGPEDRCDCFTFDPAVAGIATSYTTAAYTGAGAFHGYGIDRGHLARSFDRTSGSLDNAYTFYFSNIVPQAADLNQGPWMIMENYLGDLARFQNKEVYIIAGVAGNKGTLKNEGKIVIPEYTWKVAVIMPRDQGLANIDDYQDLEVIAVVMPNVPGVRNVNWETYKITVDSVEALSGYDLLALLPDPVEISVESNTAPPTAAVDGPYTGLLPNESITMRGAASTDPDGDALTYAWTFGDGGTGTGVNVTHAYSAGGTYNVQLIVTDPLGLADTVTTTATVLTPAQGAAGAQTLIGNLLSARKISAGNANSLASKLDAAIAAFQRGQTSAAVNQLQSLLREIDAMLRSGRLSAANAAALQTLVNRIIASTS